MAAEFGLVVSEAMVVERDNRRYKLRRIENNKYSLEAMHQSIMRLFW